MKADPPNQMSAVGPFCQHRIVKNRPVGPHRSYIYSAALLLHKVTSRRICSCNIPI